MATESRLICGRGGREEEREIWIVLYLSRPALGSAGDVAPSYLVLGQVRASVIDHLVAATSGVVVH